MSRSKWLEAARKYRELSPEGRARAREKTIAEMAAILDEFLESDEGKAGLVLLEASGEKVEFLNEYLGMGHGVGANLTAHGLEIEAGPGGTGVAMTYTQAQVDKETRRRSATSFQVAEQFYLCEKDHSGMLHAITEIRRKLNCIAERVSDKR